MARRKKRWMQEAVEHPGAYKDWIKRVEREKKIRILNKDGTIPVTFSRKICRAENNEITWHGKKIRFTTTTKRRACLHVRFYEASKKRRKKK